MQKLKVVEPPGLKTDSMPNPSESSHYISSSMHSALSRPQSLPLMNRMESLNKLFSCDLLPGLDPSLVRLIIKSRATINAAMASEASPPGIFDLTVHV